MWKAVAFLQTEPIRSLDHYAIFERSTATAAKLSEAKTPQRKTLPLCNSAAHHKRTRRWRLQAGNCSHTASQQQHRDCGRRARSGSKWKHVKRGSLLRLNALLQALLIVSTTNSILQTISRSISSFPSRVFQSTNLLPFGGNPSIVARIEHGLNGNIFQAYAELTRAIEARAKAKAEQTSTAQLALPNGETGSDS
jgi:hypothetical protein